MLIKYHPAKGLIQSARFFGFGCLALMLAVSSPSWSDEDSDDNESDDSSGKNHHVILADGMSNLYSEGLRTWLSFHDEEDEISVLITLKDTPYPQPNSKPSILDYNIDELGSTYIEKDGVEVSEQEAKDHSEQDHQENSKAYHEYNKSIDDEAYAVFSHLGWDIDTEKKSGRFLTKKLSKENILKLENVESLLESVGIYSESFDDSFLSTLKSTFDSVGLTKWGHNFLGWLNIDWRKYGYSINPVGQTSGKGIYIYMQEANNECRPWNYQSQLNYYKNIQSATHVPNKQSDIDHATVVLSVLNRAAPGATIYCGDDPLKIMKPMPKFGPNAPPAGVSNYDIVNITWGGTIKHNGHFNYTAYDHKVDKLLYNKVVSAVVASAGNKPATTLVPYPANAYNAITVGHYNHVNNTLSPNAVYLNNVTGVEKPEVVAPGVGICVPSDQYPTTSIYKAFCLGIIDNISIPPFISKYQSGSSISAPIVTGMIANLLERYSWLKGQPTRVKSMILAGASQKILLANRSIATMSKVGAGGVDFYTSGFNGNIYSFYGFVNNKTTSKDLFEINFGRTDLRKGFVMKNIAGLDGQITLETVRYIEYDLVNFPLNVGTTYRLAMSWLVPPRKKDVHTNTKGVSQDYDMEIFHKNTGINYGKSEGKNSAYELLEFTAQKSGVLTVRIYNPPTGREKNTDKQDISLALFPLYNHTN